MYVWIIDRVDKETRNWIGVFEGAEQYETREAAYAAAKEFLDDALPDGFEIKIEKA